MSFQCPKCSSPFIEKTKFCKICGCNLQLEFIENPTCPKCNTVYNSDMKFCIHDGIKLVNPVNLIPKCVKCKKTYSNGEKFCPLDGGAIKLDDEIINNINTNSPKKEEIKTNFQETIREPNPQPVDNSPKKYNKAPIEKRFLAYLIDGLIIMALFLPSLYLLFDFFAGIINDYHGSYNSEQNLIFGLILLLLPIRYALIKDGFGEGQSYGKNAVGLMVINVRTNEPCTKLNSAGRNILFSIISSIPYVGFLLEIVMVLANPEGRKLSDLGAGTQVIDKKDYK